MKKFISITALILALIFALCACNTAVPKDTTENTSSQTTIDATSGTTASSSENTTPEKPNEKKSLKVLAIGNSFSVDAMEYLWDICDSAGYDDVTLGNLYIGGCSLDTHWSNMQSNASAYDYYFNDLGFWNKTKKSIKYALESQDWDIITIQQVSGKSGLINTYEPYLKELIAYCEERNIEIIPKKLPIGIDFLKRVWYDMIKWVWGMRKAQEIETCIRMIYYP